MKKSKRMPISALKDIGKKYDKTQMVLITYDETGTKTVTTWGRSLDDCQSAALAGNIYKRMLGFPEHLCNTVPNRAKKKPTRK